MVETSERLRSLSVLLYQSDFLNYHLYESAIRDFVYNETYVPEDEPELEVELELVEAELELFVLEEVFEF